MLPAEDTVLAFVPCERIGDVLTAAHRAGFGHLTRVLDGRRSPVIGQLARAGIALPDAFAVGQDGLVVAIAAPARTARALELVNKNGATASWITSRAAPPAPVLSNPNRARIRRPVPIAVEVVAPD